MRRPLELAVMSAALLVLGLGSACPEDPPPEDPTPKRLAAADAWVRVTDPAGDVFAAMRPPEATCDDSGYFVDPFTQTFEVSTDLCDYLTMRQPTLVALGAGDVVSVRAFHYELSAPEAAEGYMALAVDGEIFWEVTVPIPAAPGPMNAEVMIDRDVPAGADLQLHVHNHGPNTWELVSLMATPAS
ncbi:MAG: hypothetical protein R3B09_18390 [Nannocystaceae bacterium]